MRFGNLIFGVALLLVATTLALTITFRNVPAEQTAIRQRSTATPASPRPPGKARPLPSATSPGKSVAPAPHRKNPGVEDLDIVLDDGPSAPAVSSAERQTISRRTAGVRRAALAKLDRMTEHFDLTAAQRRKIFPLLVQSTNGYHPAMVVTQPAGGLPVPVEVAGKTQTPDEAIHDALDPEQQEDFVEAQIDQRAWWNEIVAQLEEDFDSVVAAGTAPPEEDPAEPEIPAEGAPQDDSPQQGNNIFDLLKK